MKEKHIQHLYWRVGFGILPTELKALSKKKKKDIVNSLLDASNTITPLTVDTSEIEALLNYSQENKKENRMKIQKISREKAKELNIAWVDRLSNTDEILREKMTLFWANHFVCKDNNFLFSQNFHNTLRKHALGNFKDFVVAISQEAAMTKYLNTKQNKKQKPNENFARELMELFTLGVGNYTEDDIKESAKAFTGYGHNLKGEFVLRTRQHDEGNKIFFGKTGNFSGEDIIGIILEEKQCAKYICEKVYRYFVNENLDEAHINQMVETFYPNYDIKELMRFVLVSDWFYDENNIGTKIKSPIEFLVGIQTTVPFHFENNKRLLYLQKVLGQILLNPPNVAGWKGGKSWIDSNTIVLRLKLPSLLLNNAYISKAKIGEADNVEVQKAMFKKRYGKYYQANANWEAFNTRYKDVEIDKLDAYLLSCDMNPEAISYLNSLAKVSKQEYCIQVMSLPEYQMC
ncbi:MAG: DUF1800 domain-containing protein [Algibacter sp.]